MPIRKRITSAVKILDDTAIRVGLDIAVKAKERRIADLKAEMADGSAFDEIDSQAEIDTLAPMVAVWKRLLAMPGRLKITSEAE